jgi:ribosomal protein L7/L12
MVEPSAPLPEAARQALAQGRVIEAIKIVREIEGVGLKEAKARIDAFDGRSIAGTDAPSAASPLAAGRPLPAAAQAALARGETIAAIRIVREVEGIGLKEAKARVDAHHGRDAGLPLGHAGAPERRGAGLWVLVLLTVLLVAWWLTTR